MSYRHNRKPDLPVTHSSPLSTWLSLLFFFPHHLKPRCLGRVMGFVGGGGNIAIATALPPSSFMYCIVNIKKFMEFLYLIFYSCLRLRFLDVETNPGPRGLSAEYSAEYRPAEDLMSAEYSAVMSGSWPGTLVT